MIQRVVSWEGFSMDQLKRDIENQIKKGGTIQQVIPMCETHTEYPASKKSQVTSALIIVNSEY